MNSERQHAEHVAKQVPRRARASAPHARHRSGAPIEQRLTDHFRRLSRDIDEDFRDTIHSGTAEAVSQYRETFIQEIVGRFFPRTYRVTKGAIFDCFGGRSKSLDCVVCAPNYPLFLDSLGRMTTLLADGVHCAIELKPDVMDCPTDFGSGRKTKQLPEILRGLEQIRSVKRLLRPERALEKNPGVRLYSQRVPTHLVVIRAPKLLPLAKYIADYYVAHQVPLHEQVDKVLVLGQGVLSTQKFNPENHRDGTGGIVGNLLAFSSGLDALQFFIFDIASDIAPELPMSEPVLARYRKLQVRPKSCGGFPTVATPS